MPPELGNATSLVGLLLSSNRLGGTIPGSFLDLADLETLWLDHNRFAGPVPFELGALPTLDDDGGLDLRSNALATDTEPGLLADLNAKQVGGNWTRSQAAAAPFDPQLPLDGLADRRTGGFVVWTVRVEAGGAAAHLLRPPEGRRRRGTWTSTSVSAPRRRPRSSTPPRPIPATRSR